MYGAENKGVCTSTNEGPESKAAHLKSPKICTSSRSSQRSPLAALVLTGSTLRLSSVTPLKFKIQNLHFRVKTGGAIRDKGQLAAQTKSRLLPKKQERGVNISNLSPLLKTCLFSLRDKSGFAEGTLPTLQSLYFSQSSPLCLPLLTDNHVALRVCSEVGLMRSPLG